MSRSRSQYAFTLVEMLVVLAIVALLAALLLPVFRAARASAYKTTCLSNFRQVQFGTNLYLTDYDERFMPVNYDVSRVGDATRDRTWVQLLMPYVPSFAVHKCPSDFGNRQKSEFTFDVDLVLEDSYQRFYQASLASNMGYNYLYFSPVYREGNSWIVRTRFLGEISNVNTAMVTMDSVNRRTDAGTPTDGGSYIVVPPCRFMSTVSGVIDSFSIPPSAQIFAPNKGWLVSNPASSFKYGLAWPWHDGRLNVANVGGGAKSIPVSSLAEGCDVRDNWGGMIKDVGNYNWDVQ